MQAKSKKQSRQKSSILSSLSSEQVRERKKEKDLSIGNARMFVVISVAVQSVSISRQKKDGTTLKRRQFFASLFRRLDAAEIVSPSRLVNFKEDSVGRNCPQDTTRTS